MNEDQRIWWLISVGGYGEFGFYGTEAEAETMRIHKARWEHGVARKMSIEKHSHAAKAARSELCWQREAGYPLDEREKEAIGL